MDYKIHPMCEAVPDMRDDEYASLVKSMKTNGFLVKNAIVVKDGWIIDGRHRYVAATDAGVEPLFDEYEQPWETVPAFVAAQSCRRNLSAGQRAAAASAMATNAKGGQKKESSVSVTVAQACKFWDVGSKYLAEYRKVEAADPELAKLVRNGTVTLNAAITKIKPKPEHHRDNDPPKEEKPKAEPPPKQEPPKGDPEDVIDEALGKAKAKAKQEPHAAGFAPPKTAEEAYAALGAILGLSNDITLVKSVCKLIKQKIHPDKHNGDEKYTAMFQLLGQCERFFEPNH